MRSIGARCLLPLGLGLSDGYYVHHPLPPSVSRPRPSSPVVVVRRHQTRRPQLFLLLSSTSSPPDALGTSGNWSAYLDESKGLVYYFNPRSGESRWEPPEESDFSGIQTKIDVTKKREMRARLKNYLEERLNKSASEFVGAFSDTAVVDGMRDDGGGEATETISKKTTRKSRLDSIMTKVTTSKETETRNRDFVSEWGRWQALIDNKRGQIYYYDKWTRESSWDRPEGFPPFKLSASKRIAMEERNRLYLEWHKDSDDDGDSNTNTNDGTEERPESDSGFGTDSARTVVDKAIGDVVVSEDQPESTLGFEPDLVHMKVVDDDIIAAGGGTNDSDQPPTLFTSNPPPALPEMTINDNGNDVNTLPIVQQGDWSAYFDVQSGLVFYFNEETSETSWDPPFANFPRIVLDASGPSVLDSGSGNISMERALGYIGVDEMAEALAWEEAKKRERARKAAARAEEAKAEGGSMTSESDEGAVTKMYEAAKRAELDRIDQDRTLAAEQKAEEEAAAKLAAQEELRAADVAAILAMQEKQERLKEDRLDQERFAREREASEKLAMQERLERERLDKELLDRKRLEVESNPMPVDTNPKQPVRPKGERSGEGGGFLSFWWGRKRSTVKVTTLYDILLCSPGATRDELKRSYLSLAKETHPDALLQSGIVNDDKTERRFTEIAQAWKILGDPTSRRRYDRELQAKGISSTAGNIFETLVMGAAQALDEVLAIAEESLDS